MEETKALKDFIAMQRIIASDNPFFIGRLSGNETAFCGNEMYCEPSEQSTIENLRKVAGIFFTDQKSQKSYVQRYGESVRSCDLLANFPVGSNLHSLNSFFNLHLEKNFPLLPQIHNRCVEPYYFMGSESYHFDQLIKGKSILVISSHLESMKKQISELDYLFSHQIFCENRFQFVKPPMTYGENHHSKDWQVHWRELLDKVKGLNFDLALVSCGGYGMITAAYIREKLNKSAIYVGGALQIWFGIKGRRWNQHPVISSFYNKHWRSPQDVEIPKGNEMVENACYW